MQLIGYMDSPFVRRVAISMKFLGIDFEHRELSIFRDFEEFQKINPVVKVPTLVLDDGQVLVDSSLIIDYLERHVAKCSLMPTAPQEFLQVSSHIGIALVAMEKMAALIYETGQRPSDKQYAPWTQRLESQLKGAFDQLETSIAELNSSGSEWMTGEHPGQADISIAVAWRFALHVDAVKLHPDDYKALGAFSTRAEALPEFLACPLSG